jgi:hypothetical protein
LLFEHAAEQVLSWLTAQTCQRKVSEKCRGRDEASSPHASCPMCADKQFRLIKWLR